MAFILGISLRKQSASIALIGQIALEEGELNNKASMEER